MRRRQTLKGLPAVRGRQAFGRFLLGVAASSRAAMHDDRRGSMTCMAITLAPGRWSIIPPVICPVAEQEALLPTDLRDVVSAAPPVHAPHARVRESHFFFFSVRMETTAACLGWVADERGIAIRLGRILQTGAPVSRRSPARILFPRGAGEGE